MLGSAIVLASRPCSLFGSTDWGTYVLWCDVAWNPLLHWLRYMWCDVACYPLLQWLRYMWCDVACNPLLQWLRYTCCNVAGNPVLYWLRYTCCDVAGNPVLYWLRYMWWVGALWHHIRTRPKRMNNYNIRSLDYRYCGMLPTPDEELMEAPKTLTTDRVREDTELAGHA